MGRRVFRAAAVLVCFGMAAWPTATGARPLVDAPAHLLDEASQPCVLYSCTGNPRPHINWVNSLGSLPTGYCAEYGPCKPMDLVPDHGFDDNLFPFDPDWAYFSEHRQAPNANQLCGEFEGPLACTSYPVGYDAPGVDTAAYFACPFGRPPYFGSFHGHVNWEPATYEGTLEWEEHSPPGTDDDYSISLNTRGRAGATAARLAGVGLEFDSDETIDHFNNVTWWRQFHENVDKEDHANALVALLRSEPLVPKNIVEAAVRAAKVAKAAVEADINGHLAVVTGLIGLDTAHSVAAESHPVYEMAIETNRKSALAGGVDRWALFARNWGNEGFCSQYNHTLPPGPLTVRIPWLNNASGVLVGALARPARSVAVLKSTELQTNVSPEGKNAVHVLPGEGVLVTLDLSTPPSHEPLYWGTIDLKWTFGPPSATVGRATGTLPKGNAPLARNADADEEGEKSDVEPAVGRLWSKLPRAVRLRALAGLPDRRLARVIRPSRPARMTIAGPLIAPLRTIEAFVPPPRDHENITLGQAERDALCKAFKNHVPRYRAMCRPTTRRR